MPKTVEQLKAELAAHKGARSVEVWNSLREEAKETYPLSEIIKLDSSGYVSKWLKEEN